MNVLMFSLFLAAVTVGSVSTEFIIAGHMDMTFAQKLAQFKRETPDGFTVTPMVENGQTCHCRVPDEITTTTITTTDITTQDDTTADLVSDTFAETTTTPTTTTTTTTTFQAGGGAASGLASGLANDSMGR